MKIKMLVDACGTANESGNVTKIYKKDEHIECSSKWQEDLAKIFVAEGQAMEVKIVEPTETKAKPKVKRKKTIKK